MKIRATWLIGVFILIFHFVLAQNEGKYVLIISLDGYRHDYTKRFQPPNIGKFIQEGVAAESLIPAFPSKTFPNHYTIVSGLRPENHGIVDNTFYDPDWNKVYQINDREAVQDGGWYGGVPLWVLAEEQGIKAASYFFVGSEADIKGIRPSYYYNYDAQVSNLTRIAQVFEWLELPMEERPQMITLYFSDMDDVGHAYGPNNDKHLRQKLMKLDAQLGALLEGIKSLDLDINIFIVSDHGMAEINRNHLINLDSILHGLPVRVLNNGALAHLHLENSEDRKRVLKALKKNEDNFRGINLKDAQTSPYQLHSAYEDRLGDFLLIPDGGYYLTNTAGFVKYQNRAARLGTNVFGEHGFSPENKEMHGIFYAQGPGIKKGMQIPSFENIHIYPLICEILGLTPPEKLDGSLQTLKPILIEH